MRRIVTAAMLVVLATAGRAAAQGGAAAACVLDEARMAAVQRIPASDLRAYWDSLARADSMPRPGYAAGQPWFTSRETISFNRYPLIQYGLPRFIEAHELRRVGEYRGVGVYVSQGEWWRAEVLYLAVRPGCEFQPYQAHHWGISCAALGCPWPRQEQPPGTACRLRGDELVWAREDEEAGPPVPLATSRRWYAADRPITFRERTFVKMGLPRQLPPGSVRRIGEVDGVGVYVGSEASTEHVFAFYVPVRAGCELQLYDDDTSVYGVRGD